MTTALIFGSTGAVGSQILATLLSSPTCTSLTTISRRAPQTSNPKLQAIVEADTTKWASLIATLSPTPPVVFNAVGTTFASAGSVAAQWAIDHDLCVENAKAAKAAGVKTYVYCSSAGTSSSFSPFALTPYAKMKRGVETAIKELDFENAVVLRPGMILGREKPKNKWLEDIFDGMKRISQGFQDACGMCDFNMIYLSKANRVCSTRSDCYWKSCGSCCGDGRSRHGSREVLGVRANGYCKAGKR
jgi:dTDP-4-dehydrorhamnose reductase